jgi:DNA-binding transcriptional LysR family regulator
MKELSFGDLHLFARVAELGTLSAVARERDAPVSQVSRGLARIEKACGAQLVHRSTHGLSLSAQGITFLEHCQRIIGTLDELEGEFASEAGEVSGLVRVAASTVIAQYQLLPSLTGLGQRHPRLRIELEVGDRLADMARDGIDIAIRTSTQPPETVVARRIGTLARALYAAPDYLAGAGLPRHPEELRHHRLITNSAVATLNHWPFVVQGRKFTLVAEGHWRSNDTNVVASMALQGLGIARLASITAEPLVRQKRLLAVLPDFVDRQPVPIFAMTAGGRHRLPKIRACIDYWTQWLADMSP